MIRSPSRCRAFGPFAVVLVLAAAGLNSACSPVGVVVGASATVGVAAAQERSVGNAIDDNLIAIEINHYPFQKSEALFRRVDLKVIEGRVLLTGSVPAPDDRIEAARLTWQADGVREVLNEIQVDDRSGVLNYAKDAWITTQLHVKLLRDREISDINNNVETVNSVIYLIGIAKHDRELERVTGHARTISGVTKVISHVRLKDDPRRQS